jgi:predicted nucleic acid-binding protein
MMTDYDDAEPVVTGDSDLLALNPFQGIEIISPHVFLELKSRNKF